ncbi:helix-turn-helix domain-containing protein [Kitasatospora cathayae]|uniref:Helix-turn-helix transcriptional regulator n=1 Tax=Kitasatospora cathayae TaxID=3004092 RepID=A0ABY7Q5Q0_9ACTN|nr:helix-turn-helix transcriptional regulator [Kitasatospora sp. HUAS 3-15]WBP87474.1 helix-turn-helix transcriptional regulator [Kitasatospora sp. HUAS 3-15]
MAALRRLLAGITDDPSDRCENDDSAAGGKFETVARKFPLTWLPRPGALRHTDLITRREDVMALRSNPTLRQRRLGTELRRIREQAGLGGSQLARELGIQPAQITQMESGKSGISVERLRTIAAVCMCTNQPLIDAMARMASERGKGWWEEYRATLTIDFLEVAELEGHAERISFCNTVYLPGLLQTKSYASAMFARLVPPLPPQDVETRTTFRLRRQEVVQATPVRAFIHEAALRMQFGGPLVLIDQLAALLNDAERPGLSIRVVPFDVDTFPGTGENLTYVEGPVPELDTVQMDVAPGTLFFDSPANLAKYRTIFSSLDATALSEEQSCDFIRSIMKEMKSTYA